MIRNDDIGPSKLPQTVGFNVPDLPIDLHTRIKSAAAAQRKTLKQFVFEALEEKLARE